MPFIPIQPCCLKGTVLPGDPRGEILPIGPGRTIGQYKALPQDGNIRAPNTAVVLFYDAFGFAIPNAKILADTFADHLGLPVFVPDYIPDPLPPTAIDPLTESFPGEHKTKGWLATIYDWLAVLPKMVYLVPRILTGTVLPRCQKAVEELTADGYTHLGAIGYCRGGAMIINLLSNGDASTIACAVITHPSPEPALYKGITRPTQWHLADHDMMFKDKQIAELRQVLEGKAKDGVQFEYTLHEETTHGFGARPNLEHEPTKKAFEASNEAAVGFFKKHLLSAQ